MRHDYRLGLGAVGRPRLSGCKAIAFMGTELVVVES